MSALTLIYNYFHFKSNEKKSREKILFIREKKFRKILKYAYNNSTFYRQYYLKHGIEKKDLEHISIEDLPIVDKNSIMDNFNDVVTADDVDLYELKKFLDENKNPNDLFKEKYHVLHTSGASGKIGIFIYSKKDWDSFYPVFTRLYHFNFKKKKTVFFGATDGHYGAVSCVLWGNKGIVGLFNRSLALDIKEPVEKHIELLNKFQPEVVSGYFTGLKILADLQNKDLLKINPEQLVNVGESINSKDKKFIETVFNAPLSNSYGISECCVAGVGKDKYNGIAIFDDIVYIEIKKDHILITNLFNKTQPLIRYRIDDYLKLNKYVSEDFPFTVVEDIIGRQESTIWLENKHGEMDFIHPIVIAELYVNGLSKLQIVLKDKNSFDFLAVIDEKNKVYVVSKIKEKLDEILISKDFTNVRYNIKIVDRLDADKKTGKFKLIVKR